MARAENLESAGGGGGGGGGGGRGGGGADGERGGPGPLVQPSTCRMELPRPGFQPWPGMLSAAAGYSLRRHPLPPSPPPPAQPEGPLLPRSSLPPRTRREEKEERPRAEARVCSGERPAEERTGSDREEVEQQEASREQGPPADMQPQTEHPSWASARRGLPGDVVLEEDDIRRVAHQLRAIGDQINASVFHRAHAAPQWRDWRSACLELLNFVSQTLETLYRLT